ncbi:hypothetical protein SAMCFNEI73_pB0410 (plasmid) [Sinorhizobium americanum]|uniref:Uncharacterized protein n=1 Tax=Sinorhizobium americanum TaxID=194963 RepID=A0A1L3LU68_9HYPH|nr:hypothetical protein SAMCFNEI73_pB0410 [Sinorhizobium americanum]
MVVPGRLVRWMDLASQEEKIGQVGQPVGSGVERPKLDRETIWQDW